VVPGAQAVRPRPGGPGGRVARHPGARLVLNRIVQPAAIDTTTPPGPLPPNAIPVAPGRRERLALAAHAAGLLPMLQRCRRWLRHDLRVFAYHRVRPLDAGYSFDPMLVSALPDEFATQMRWLRDRFHPVRCEQVVEAIEGGRALPPDSVLVTFDDGYDDNYHIAFPILRELGVPATFFVATGHIDSGAPFAYDWLVHALRTSAATVLEVPELGLQLPLPAGVLARTAAAETLLDRLKSLDDAGQQAVMTRLLADWRLARPASHPDCRPMSWDQLRAMRSAGMSIGAHGVHHRMLAKLAPGQMTAELAEAKSRLDAELGADINALSYPVGGPDAFDDAVIAAARRAGFVIAFSYIAGTNGWHDLRRHALRRLPVERHIGQRWFNAIAAVPELFGHPSAFRAYPG
jgi:peptidoglycan/xylan/chitin deacetylase (PgdA/CDA1 family)